MLYNENQLLREENRLSISEFSLPSARVLESLNLMITIIKEEIKRLRNNINDHIDQDPKLKEPIKSYDYPWSRPGISSYDDIIIRKDFKKSTQVAAFLGLIPKIKESGLMKGRSTLSKTGSPLYRARLYMTSIFAGQWTQTSNDKRRIY